MNMIKCPKCEKEISDIYDTCPGCGHKLKEPEQDQKPQQSKPKKKTERSDTSKILKKIGGGLIIFSIMIQVFAIWIPDPPEIIGNFTGYFFGIGLLLWIIGMLIK